MDEHRVNAVGVEDAPASVAVAALESGARHDVVFTFACETWADAHDRQWFMSGDRLALSLMNDPRVGRLVVANPYRSTPVWWARVAAGQRATPFPDGGGRALCEPRRVRRHDPTSVRSLERCYHAYDRALERAAADLGADRPAVITTNPFVAAFAPLRWAGRVTLYAWDDWASMPTRRGWRPAYEQAYARVRRSGRSVVAVSQAILDRIGPTGSTAVVPNGIEPAEWRSPPIAPTWFANLPPPRILYIGALGERLDIEAVVEVASRFAHGTVVLLGPQADPSALVPLRGLPNVRIQPAVGRSEVVGLVHAADVCVMPHRRTPLTEAMSPLKIYEYLAGGRPVVATDLPPVRRVDPRIVRVPVGGSFAAGVAEALASGPLTEPERVAFIEANSWHRRHEAILAVALGSTGEDS